MASKIEIKSTPKRDAEDAAVPGIIGLTKGGKTDPKEQDEDHEGAEVETKAPHGMVPERLKDDLLKTILSRV